MRARIVLITGFLAVAPGLHAADAPPLAIETMIPLGNV